MTEEKRITIAIDGPAGSGKSTTARLLADRLGYIHVDTGAMYRAITHHWLQLGIGVTEENMNQMLETLKLDIVHTGAGQKTMLNGEDVSDAIRRPEVDRNVSEISAAAAVRRYLHGIQRKLGKNGGAIMDGRDIGTVVFPEANLKIFLVASVDTRAARRKKQNELKGQYYSIDEIKKQIIDRDNLDSTRDIAPLKKAEDAIEIDTSGLEIQEQVEKIEELARKVLRENE
ncbi:MAG: (d)CMP kinase [Candidatus Kapaibacteriales bacterium]